MARSHWKMACASRTSHASRSPSGGFNRSGPMAVIVSPLARALARLLVPHQPYDVVRDLRALEEVSPHRHQLQPLVKHGRAGRDVGFLRLALRDLVRQAALPQLAISLRTLPPRSGSPGL